MTQDEKIEIIGGINDFFTRPNPRLGIPALKMSDGPMGVHDYGLTTAYPAGIALAGLKPVARPDGIHTAGSSSQVADGGCGASDERGEGARTRLPAARPCD